MSIPKIVKTEKKILKIFDRKTVFVDWWERGGRLSDVVDVTWDVNKVRLKKAVLKGYVCSDSWFTWADIWWNDRKIHHAHWYFEVCEKSFERDITPLINNGSNWVTVNVGKDFWYPKSCLFIVNVMLECEFEILEEGGGYSVEKQPWWKKYWKYIAVATAVVGGCTTLAYAASKAR